ncbi:Autophagy protein Atg8 ubiquitin-like [Dillenia turbinata]|uniref:Autophagy-related protein n=1 Tax=Dillenia turbinata TaxID=194707 RepID=A0AAN8VVQ3_9MAGN
MGRVKTFRGEFTFEERFQESNDIVAKYPDRVPERFLLKLAQTLDFLFQFGDDFEYLSIFACIGTGGCGELGLVCAVSGMGGIFLVPRDMSVGQFIHILSSRLHLTHGKALFVCVKNTLPQISSLMESIYESFRDDDGFLYMCYSSKKTFGYANTQKKGMSLVSVYTVVKA